MAADEKWYFTKEQLANTPSRRCGIDADKELSYRQQAANFIQDMGQRLHVSQLCINTAIVYMHRFYVFHSLSQFHRNSIASAALFLAAKVEEQPRKLEHVINMAHTCLHRQQIEMDTRSEQYLEQAQDLVFNENALLQTLAFDVAIDHPHTHVVRCCHLVKASKDLAQTSYFMASNSLHLTTMCLQYKPTVVACFCIHLACKWSNWEIPQSNEGKHWFWYVDNTVTSEQLQQLTAEFLHIFDKCPSRLKRKIMSISANQSPSLNHPSLPNSPFDAEPRRVQSPAVDGGPTFQSSRPFPIEDSKKSSSTLIPISSSSSSSRVPMDYREYREKKERERMEREKSAASLGGGGGGGGGLGGVVPGGGQSVPEIPQKVHHSHSHHGKPIPSSSQSLSGKHQAAQSLKPLHHNHHHGGHRPDVKPSSSSSSVPQSQSQRHGSSASASSAGQSSRPRVPRDYNLPVSGNLTNPSLYNHPHQSRDSLVANIDDLPANITAESSNPISRDSRDIERPSNHNRSEVKHEKSSQSIQQQQHQQQQQQQRGFDPRVKIPEHRSKDDGKSYAKYQEQQQLQQQQQQRNRKVQDSVEQRSEEVRKLIEKPISLPKSSMRAEVVLQREDYIANMLKPSHNPKNSSSMPTGSSGVTGSAGLPRNALDYGHFPATQRDKTLVKGPPSSVQSLQTLKYDKNDVKNGNSQSNVTDDTRNRLPSSTVPSQPIKQHKSLFSPEKTSSSRDSHSSRLPRQSRQKTSPVSTPAAVAAAGLSNPVNSGNFKTSKLQERVPDPMAGNLDSGAFDSPQGIGITMNYQEPKQSSHGKRHRTSSIGDTSKSIKTEIKIEPEDNRDNYETMRLLGRVPELLQPIRDNPNSTNGRSSHSGSVMNDLKPPELIKPLDPEPITRQSLTNGIDTNMPIKSEELYRDSQDSGLGSSQLSKSSLDYLSPLKSAQSISALLQEPLAPMPSILTAIDDYGPPQLISQLPQTRDHDNQRSYHVTDHSSDKNLSNIVATSVVKEEKELLSTVDISALSAPQQTIPESLSGGSMFNLNQTQNSRLIVTVPTTTTTTATTNNDDTNALAASAAVSSRKSDHHKSEKKKKKEKHKHKEKEKDKDKDKDKSREKRKHKHKDKEREKRIKITIPKDKLNLSTETSTVSSQLQTNVTIGQEKKSSPQETTGLKIKIQRERLKGNSECTTQQAPLKLKIRTSGGNALGEGAETSSRLSTGGSSRKRERNETSNDPSGGPPSKKQHQHHSQTNAIASTTATTTMTTHSGLVPGNVVISFGQHQQRQQNGRHYSSNNKEKHSSSSHHKSSGKLTQAQQQALVMQQQQQLQQHHHSHST